MRAWFSVNTYKKLDIDNKVEFSRKFKSDCQCRHYLAVNDIWGWGWVCTTLLIVEKFVKKAANAINIIFAIVIKILQGIF